MLLLGTLGSRFSGRLDTGIGVGDDLAGVLNGKSVDNKSSDTSDPSISNGNKFVVGKILELRGSDPVELSTGELVIISVNDRPSSKVVVFDVSAGTNRLESENNTDKLGV